MTIEEAYDILIDEDLCNYCKNCEDDCDGCVYNTALDMAAKALREKMNEQVDAQLTSTVGRYDYTAKADNGKMRISIVPKQIISDVAEVREYGIRKYKEPDNWKRVEMTRYCDALFRHFLRFTDNPFGKDEESGIYHYKHIACNIAFICEQMNEAIKKIEEAEDERCC